MRYLYVPCTQLMFVASVFAQQGKTPSSGFNTSFLPMMIIMFVVIYFFMIRPEQKKQKDKKDMLGNLKKGDKVLTVGGIYGTVGNIRDDAIMVRIGDNTTVKFSKSAISTVITNKEESKEIKEEKK